MGLVGAGAAAARTGVGVGEPRVRGRDPGPRGAGEGSLRAAAPVAAGGYVLRRFIYPKQRDSADMDALQVSTLGKGIPPLIKSNNVSGAN